jgi:hypothetical protein
LRLEVFNPCTNEKGTVKGTESGLYGVLYCTVLGTPGTVWYISVWESTVRGTVLTRTVFERIGTVTTISGICDI